MICGTNMKMDVAAEASKVHAVSWNQQFYSHPSHLCCTGHLGEKYFLSPKQAISLVLSDRAVVQSLLPFWCFQLPSHSLSTFSLSAETGEVGARTILVRGTAKTVFSDARFPSDGLGPPVANLKKAVQTSHLNTGTKPVLDNPYCFSHPFLFFFFFTVSHWFLLECTPVQFSDENWLDYIRKVKESKGQPTVLFLCGILEGRKNEHFIPQSMQTYK